MQPPSSTQPSASPQQPSTTKYNVGYSLVGSDMKPNLPGTVFEVDDVLEKKATKSAYDQTNILYPTLAVLCIMFALTTKQHSRHTREWRHTSKTQSLCTVHCIWFVPCHFSFESLWPTTLHIVSTGAVPQTSLTTPTTPSFSVFSMTPIRNWVGEFQGMLYYHHNTMIHFNTNFFRYLDQHAYTWARH